MALRSKTRLASGVGALAVTLLLAGCAGGSGSVPDASIVSAADCADPGTAGRIPDGFEPVRAILCDEFGTVTDADGVWSGPATRHLVGDLSPLIDALGQPDDPRWPGACSAVGVIAPHIWLADADGHAVHVAYPVNGCGMPKTEAVHAALAALRVTTDDVDRQTLIESRAAVEAGCSTQWSPLRVVGPDELKDIPGLELSDPSEKNEGADEFETIPFGLPPAGQVDGMRLCRYAADPNLESSELAGHPTLGTFTSGSMLTAQEARIILAAADYEVMPLIACIRPASEFVVAHPQTNGEHAGGTITIELDGCQRLFGNTGFTLVSEEILELVRSK